MFSIQEPRKLDRFMVFGERRSGTNAVEAFLAANTSLMATSEFGWKHGVPSYPVLPRRCLFVVVVRDAFDWLSSFYRAPFETPNAIADLPFPDFLRAAWRSNFLRAGGGWSKQGYRLHFKIAPREELQLDRHPLTGASMENVVALRTMKLHGHLSLLTRGINAVVIRYEDFCTDPEALLRTVAEHFALDLPETIEPIEGYVGPRYGRPRKLETIGFSQEDRNFVLGHLDLRLEAMCGYHYPTT